MIKALFVMLLDIPLTPGLFASNAGASHGTINILLSNGNGMVLVTDSRVSYEDHTHSDHAQKIYQLDSATACSFAGSASDPGLFFELGTETGGLIRGYREALANASIPLTFKEKVSALSLLLSGRYESLTMIYKSAHNPRALKSNTIQLLFAGYDVDGSPAAAKVIIEINPAVSDIPTLSVDIKKLDSHFLFLTAGYDDSTQRRLIDPSLYLDSGDTEVLRHYALAKSEKRVDLMSLPQLEELADYLERDASGASIIGGPVQSAIISHHNVDVRRVGGLDIAKVPRLMSIYADETFKPSDHPQVISPPPVAYVNVLCDSSAVILDENVFYGGFYDHCSFLFDGGTFRVDKTVSVLGGRLVVGPDVKSDDPRVSAALVSLPGLEIVSYKKYRWPESWLRDYWPSHK